MLAVGIEGRSGSAAVAQKTFHGLAEIAPAQNRNNVLRNTIPQIRNNDRHAVDDRIFAQTLPIGTNQHALYQRLMGLLGDRANVEGFVASSGLPATGAEGLKFFKMKQFNRFYPPIITVGQPGGIILPTGAGMGATQLICAVMSFTLPAGIPPIMTVIEPMATVPGPAGTQPAVRHGTVVLPTLAAGCPPMMTLNAPMIIGSGKPGCGAGVGTGAGG
jgi:hypothetical protein